MDDRAGAPWMPPGCPIWLRASSISLYSTSALDKEEFLHGQVTAGIARERAATDVRRGRIQATISSLTNIGLL